jgi:oligopeptidase A
VEERPTLPATPHRRRATGTPTDESAVSDHANPLLSESYRIPFHRLGAEHVRPGVREILERGRRRIDDLAGREGPDTFDAVLGELDDITSWVEERINPVRHLLSVAETRPLREAYNEVLPEISSFWTRLPLHEGLWARVKAYGRSADAASLEGVRRRHLQKTVREFRRAGADLPAGKRERLEVVKVELARLQQKFGENVLDATAAWERLVEDEERLAGMPPPALARARAKAAEEERDGWLLTLDQPSVEPVLKYVEDREIRRDVFEAYTGRCRAGEFDNRPLILDILRSRHEVATLLGYEDFPDYRLESYMAGSGERAIAFERDLVALTRPYWVRDVDRLRRHATELGLDRLRPWDVGFVSEHLRRAEYDLDDEMLRPYFPLEQVMDGLFRVVERVFGISAEPRDVDEVWHPDVRFYELGHEDGTKLGAFYTDWFPRKEKRQGAWMNDFITGGPREDGRFDPHLGVICGNFTPPEGGQPSLLTHREVQTIFHEFGHLLHHCASRVPVKGRSGLNVPWDFVELPSQFMENWTWERQALDLFARHHETGEPLPDDLFDRMVRAKRFNGGWGQLRQLSFGTVDLALHEELAPGARELDTDDVMAFAVERFRDFSPEPEFAEHHILAAFTHLFSGGYAAAYYSYLWSEVLDADAFTRFRQAGIFDRKTGREYVSAILERGDAAPPEELFRAFMGRDPDPGALLERNLGPSPDPGAGAPGGTAEQPGPPGAA